MFIDVLIVGIMVGAIYTLVTIGYSMVYGMLKLMNFAHGDVYIFGTLLRYTLLAQAHLHPLLGMLMLALLGFTYGTLSLLTRSKFGRAFVAIREDELAASVMGINTPMYKILNFSIGSLYAGLAGSYLAVYQTTVTPSNFRLEDSCLMIIMVIVGGMGSLAATFLGVTVMVVAIEFFRPLPEYRLLIIGLIMILVLLFRPLGLLGASAFKD